MRQIGDDVFTRQSRYWQTNTGVIGVGDAAVLVDPGVFPDELADLAADLAEAQLTVVAGVTTHEHWDHILWASSLSADAPRYSSERSAAWARQERDQIDRWLTREESANNVQWERGLIGQLTPVPHGPIGVDGLRGEFLPLPGHTNGHSGLWLPDRGVAFVGDMLSDIDPPSLSSGNEGEIESYLATLDALRALVQQADVIVPGHGTGCDSDEALRRYEMDLDYLTGLISAADATDGQSTDELAIATTKSLGDERLASDTGQQLHRQNIQDLLAARREAYQPMMTAERQYLLLRWHLAASEELHERGVQESDYLGLQLLIPEEVMPTTPMSDLLGTAVLGEVSESDRVLDMGTGCGANALLAARRAADVTAVDINRRAVGAAKANAERNGFSNNISIHESDLFDAVDGQFDLIIFDPPFRWFKPRDLLEVAFADENYETLTRFFAEVPARLSPNGRVLLFFGTTGDIDYLHHLIDRAGLTQETLASRALIKDGVHAEYFTFRLTR